jgi:hypothetical protein
VLPIEQTTIKDYFGMNTVVPWKTTKSEPMTLAYPGLIMGLELEIEQLNNHLFEASPPEYGRWETDNSLRNGGYEFITKPATASHLFYAIKELFAKMKVSERNYSERCSIHVHVNCQDITWQQMATLAMLYQTFEHLLFAFIGGDRNKNIFCVPWYETQLTFNSIDKLRNNPGHIIKKWYKYTALNLIPLQTQGTIEFRHMHGNCDPKFILNWLNLIGCLFRYATEHTLDEVTKLIIGLNTSSAYKNVCDAVFMEWSELLYTSNFTALLEEGVINMKYCLMNDGNAPPRPTVLGFDDLVAALDNPRARENVDPFTNNPYTRESVWQALRPPTADDVAVAAALVQRERANNTVGAIRTGTGRTRYNEVRPNMIRPTVPPEATVPPTIDIDTTDERPF